MAAPGVRLRDFNRARLLAAVRQGASSRAELGAVTGLARSTVAGLVRELLDDGLLAEGEVSAGRRSRGRPARRLHVPTVRHVVAAVDFGHSHCRVALLEVGDEARLLAEETATLDVDASPERAIDRAAELTTRVMAAVPDRPPVAGAIGLPAPVDVRTGTVGVGNLLERWADRRPAAELSQRLGVRFTLDNDANLGALAESRFGAARGVEDLIYVKAATGIGAGLMLGGRIHHGRSGRAGEIGHVPVDPNGALCRCGNRGCLETLAAVPQVLAALGDGGGRWADAPHDMDGVAALAHVDDAGTVRVVGDAGRLIGRALADLVNVLNPEQILIGGQLALAGEPLLAGIRESVTRFAQPGLARDLPISLSRLQETAELLGAAALAATLAAEPG